MAEIPASRLLPFKNAITHTISLSACTCGVESAAPERLLVSPERSPLQRRSSHLGSARSGPYCVAEQSSRGDGRLFGEDPAQKHIVRLSVGVRTAIAGYRNPVIEVEGLAEGGEDNTAGMHACEHKGFDGFRLQNSLEIGPAEGADTMLDNNRLTFDRSNSGVDLRSRTACLKKPVLGKDRKYRVARADLRVAGAKGDDDVNDQHVGGPRGGE